ncbi:hypothetical protein C8F04DRAFT_1185907 [Mycena alexandri]|uniref:Uncharacterized protein n=1 Tax=Mycena alexandri TaxID=1745969 RepID=A0AAD6SS34_9AGAR|nr:hypothetical protein C8F04DRAFT_1185907 [Mycena alexandri]
MTANNNDSPGAPGHGLGVNFFPSSCSKRRLEVTSRVLDLNGCILLLSKTTDPATSSPTLLASHIYDVNTSAGHVIASPSGSVRYLERVFLCVSLFFIPDLWFKPGPLALWFSTKAEDMLQEIKKRKVDFNQDEMRGHQSRAPEASKAIRVSSNKVGISLQFGVSGERFPSTLSPHMAGGPRNPIFQLAPFAINFYGNTFQAMSITELQAAHLIIWARTGHLSAYNDTPTSGSVPTY